MTPCPSCQLDVSASALKCPHCLSRTPGATTLHRGAPGRVLGGVCAGLAAYFGIDPVLVRVLLLISLPVTGGLAVWAYFALWMVTPPSPSGVAPLARFLQGLGRIFQSSPQGQVEKV